MYDELFDRYITPLHPIPTSLAPAGKPKAPVSALLLDVYGTLFISHSGDIGSDGADDRRTEQLAIMLDRYRLDVTTDSLVSCFFEAVSSAHAKMRKTGIDYPEIVIEHIWMAVLDIDRIVLARQFAMEYELIVNPVYPMPHISDLLSAAGSKNILTGIISNAQFYTPLLFKHFCGGRPETLGFDAGLILYSYRLGVAKPSLVPFRIAAERLAVSGIRTENALYVGNDILNDVAAARAVGFQTALFAGDARSLNLRTDDPRCEGVQPDMVVTDLAQLIDHLQ